MKSAFSEVHRHVVVFQTLRTGRGRGALPAWEQDRDYILKQSMHRGVGGKIWGRDHKAESAEEERIKEEPAPIFSF